jgi:hypothetical protein
MKTSIAKKAIIVEEVITKGPNENNSCGYIDGMSSFNCKKCNMFSILSLAIITENTPIC